MHSARGDQVAPGSRSNFLFGMGVSSLKYSFNRHHDIRIHRVVLIARNFKPVHWAGMKCIFLSVSIKSFVLFCLSA